MKAEKIIVGDNAFVIKGFLQDRKCTVTTNTYRRQQQQTSRSLIPWWNKYGFSRKKMAYLKFCTILLLAVIVAVANGTPGYLGGYGFGGYYPYAYGHGYPLYYGHGYGGYLGSSHYGYGHGFGHYGYFK